MLSGAALNSAYLAVASRLSVSANLSARSSKACEIARTMINLSSGSYLVQGCCLAAENVLRRVELMFRRRTLSLRRGLGVALWLFTLSPYRPRLCIRLSQVQFSTPLSETIITFYINYCRHNPKRLNTTIFDNADITFLYLRELVI